MYITSYKIIILLCFSLCLIIILIGLNKLLALNNPNYLKSSPFECGYSNISQTRTPFHIHFYLVGLLFLIFDLEIALIYPYIVSSYTNGILGYWMIIIFLLILTIGFIFELGKNAIAIKNLNNNN